MKQPGTTVVAIPTVLTSSGKKATFTQGEAGNANTLELSALPVVKGREIALQLEGAQSTEGRRHEWKMKVELESGASTWISGGQAPDGRRYVGRVYTTVVGSRDEMEQRLKDTLVTVEFREVELVEALGYLEAVMKQGDPLERPVRFVAAGEAQDARATVVMTNTPVKEALGYLAMLTGRTVTVTEDGAVLSRAPAD